MAPAPRPAGTVAWVDLSTPDLDGAGTFYRGLLGWSLETSETPLGRYVVGSVSQGTVAGMMAPVPGSAAPPAWTVFFGTDDIDSTYALAVDAGATGLQAPMEIPGGSRVAVVADPAGAVVGLMHATSEEGMVWAEAGAVAWVETASRDLVASRSFYERVFGWSAREGTNGYWSFEHDGDQVAGLMAMPAEVPEEVPSYWLPYFAVSDVDDTCSRATGQGGTVIVPAMTVEAMRFAVVQDPAQAVFGVLQWRA